MKKQPVYIRTDFDNVYVELTDDQTKRLCEFARELENSEAKCGRCGVSKEETESIDHIVEDECVDGHTWEEEA